MKETETSDDVVRVASPALDAILGVRFPVLDDGFVRLIDYMGGDAAIVQAARVSYGRGTKQVHQDRGLIRYLMQHRHTTPFEMCEVKLHLRVPMDCWRQWVRHRTSSVNEYSTRYSIAIDAAQKTAADEWRLQSESNKQGGAGRLDAAVGAPFTAREDELHRLAREVYTERLERGIAREQARKDLPLATYTEAYWKINLHNLLHFLELRMDEHAQLEIREYARTIGHQIVQRWCPLAWEAFMDFRVGATVLSGAEQAILAAVVQGNTDEAVAIATARGWLQRKADGALVRSRERTELEEKLQALGAAMPW